MARKLISIATLIVVAAALLPAVAAFAADGSADLDAQYRDVFPANAAALSVTVSPTSISSGDILFAEETGEPVTRVIIDLPFGINNADCAGFTASDGDAWTCRAVNDPTSESRLIYGTQDDGITPGETESFPATANILTANVIERTSTVKVLLAGSDDPNNFERAEGDLDITVHGLELIQGITLDENRTGAASVTRYTAGQVIDANFDLTSRTSADAAIAAQLSSPTFTGTPVAGANPLPAGTADETYSFDIDTSVYTGEPRTRETFTARAQGTANGNTGDAVTINGANVVNFTELQNIDVEAPVRLTLGNATTVLVDGANDLTVPSKDDTSLSIAGTKFNYPLVDLTSGSANSELLVRISGCDPNGEAPTDEDGNAIPVVCEITSALDEVTSPNGATSYTTTLPRIGNNNADLRFNYNNLDLAQLNPDVKRDANGDKIESDLVDLDAYFTFAGTDDNAADFAPVTFDFLNLLTIDLAAPIIRLDTPVGNVLANRVADADTVTFSGYVAHNRDLDSNDADGDGTSFSVVAESTQPAIGVDLPDNRSVTVAGQEFYSEEIADAGDLGGETDCEGTPEEDSGRVCQFFSVDITMPGTKNDSSGEFTTALGLGGPAALTQRASGEDDADNPALVLPYLDDNGIAKATNIAIDNDHPTINPTLILEVNDPADPDDDTREALSYYVNLPVDADNNPATPMTEENVVRVAYDAGIFNDTLTGGCDNDRWEVVGPDDVTVERVYFNDGTPCVDGQTPAGIGDPSTDKNDRLLLLTGDINPAVDTWNFNYVNDTGIFDLDGPGDDLTDDLGNIAYDQTGRILDLLTPAIPNLVDVLREDTFDGGPFEAAGQRTDVDGITSYYANISNLEINVNGFQPGADFLEIYEVAYDANGDRTLGDQIGGRISTANLTADGDTIFLTHEDINYTETADDSIVLHERAFRFVRVTEGQTIIEIPGTARFVNFIYDTVDLKPKSAELALDTTDDDGNPTGDQVTIGFGGDDYNTNDIALLFGADADWSSKRDVVFEGETFQSRDEAVEVANRTTEVVLTVDYRGNADGSDFYGGNYLRNFLPMADGETVEDLAGNELAYHFDITKGNPGTYVPK